MRFALFSALPLCAAMTACATSPSSGGSNEVPPAIQSDGGNYNCENADLAEFAGKTGSAEVYEQARIKANARHVRVVKPGMAVTMDYRIDRLTVMLDDNGKIESISCG